MPRSGACFSCPDYFGSNGRGAGVRIPPTTTIRALPVWLDMLTLIQTTARGASDGTSNPFTGLAGSGEGREGGDGVSITWVLGVLQRA